MIDHLIKLQIGFDIGIIQEQVLKLCNYAYDFFW
jgi:hypothetical protein